MDRHMAGPPGPPPLAQRASMPSMANMNLVTPEELWDMFRPIILDKNMQASLPEVMEEMER
jgi:hypothetical protein